MSCHNIRGSDNRTGPIRALAGGISLITLAQKSLSGCNPREPFISSRGHLPS